jgi:hypothetical protein
VLAEDGQMEQYTSPVKVMTRKEIEVRLIGAVSTGDVIMEMCFRITV